MNQHLFKELSNFWEQINEKGYYCSNISALDDIQLKTALIDFLAENNTVKEKYLQKEFGYAFDGYSFLGQKDSTNQGADDLVHTFVCSDFFKKEKYPSSFKNYMTNNWAAIKKYVREIEQSILEYSHKSNWIDFYQSNIGHMVSCNYYPSVQNKNFTEKPLRLTAHVDVSLFTIFPFGLSDGLIVQDKNKSWIPINSENKLLIFPGYLMELISDGKIKALQHAVSKTNSFSEERFSFAFFSLPFPNLSFKLGDKPSSSKDYFQKYLDLFK